MIKSWRRNGAWETGEIPSPPLPQAAELHDSHGQHVAVNSSSDYITEGWGFELTGDVIASSQIWFSSIYKLGDRSYII